MKTITLTAETMEALRANFPETLKAARVARWGGQFRVERTPAVEDALAWLTMGK